MMDKAVLIVEIIEHEWFHFDKVKNTDGRAPCQDDWNTFRIMRAAQYVNWPKKLLESYLADLKSAELEGRNLISEKYAHMMKSTFPQEYQNIKHLLPHIENDRLLEQEKIISIEMAMDKSFCIKYPAYAASSRSLYTDEDSPYLTSKETYIRGEISTWSDRTFAMYSNWAKSVEAKGENISEMIAENIVKAYGYTSLADAEKRLKFMADF